MLLLEDHVPYVLGTRPRFVLDGIGHGWRRHVDLPGALRRARPLRDRPDDACGSATRSGWSSSAAPSTPPRRSPSPRARCPLPDDPARRRLDRLRRQPAPRLRHRQRRGRHRPRVPPRRRPAPGALAQLGPGRRADGAPRGAALAVAGDPVPRQPRCAPTAARASRRRWRRPCPPPPRSPCTSSQRGFTVRLVTAAGEDPSTAWHSRDADAQHRAPAGGARRRRSPCHSPQLDTGWLAEAGARRPAASPCSAASSDADGPILRRMQHHAGTAAGHRARRRRRGLGRAGRAPAARRRPAHPAGLAGRRRCVRATGSTAVWQELGRSGAHAVARSRPTRRGRRTPGGDPAEPGAQRARRRRRCSPRVAAATTWVAMLSWSGFTCDPARFLGPLFVLAVVVAGGGVLARWWRVPARAGRPACQVVVVGAGAAARAQRLARCRRRDAWPRLGRRSRTRSSTADRYAAPVPAPRAAGVDPLLIVGGAGLPAARRLPRLHACAGCRWPGCRCSTVYSVPVSLIGGGVAWLVFAADRGRLPGDAVPARRASRWPAGDARSARTRRRRPERLRRARPAPCGTSAGAIGAVATALACSCRVLIPTLDLHLFDVGPRPGRRRRRSGSRTRWPTCAATCTQGEDIPLIRVTTDDPDPAYLRIVGAEPVQRQRVELRRPRRPERPTGATARCRRCAGVASSDQPHRVPLRRRRSTADFGSTLAADPSRLSQIVARRRLALRHADDGLHRRRRRPRRPAGMTYSMTGVEPRARRAPTMAPAPAAPATVGTDYTRAARRTCPRWSATLAPRSPQDAPTRFQKAVALQHWFRENGGFTLHDLDDRRRQRHRRPGRLPRRRRRRRDGLLRAVRRRDGRDGPHPAASRPGSRWASSSPTRSAATRGSTAPTTCTPGPSCSSPAPAGCASSPRPAARRTRPRLHHRRRPGQQPEPAARQRPAAQRRPAGPRVQRRAPAQRAGRRPDDRRRRRLPVAAGRRRSSACWSCSPAWRCCPRLVRRRRRDRRWPGGPRTAWAELRDTALDLGVPWRRRRSPRGARPAPAWSALRRPGRRAPPSGRAAAPRWPRAPWSRWTGSSRRSSARATPARARGRGRESLSADAERRASPRSTAALPRRPAPRPSGCRGRCSSVDAGRPAAGDRGRGVASRESSALRRRSAATATSADRGRTPAGRRGRPGAVRSRRSARGGGASAPPCAP